MRSAYGTGHILLNVYLTTATVVSKVPHMPAVLAHGESSSAVVDICPPSGSLRGPFCQAKKCQVISYDIH